MIPRSLKLSKSNSFFLFGPRGVGKTTLIKSQFDPANSLYVDLLDDSLRTKDDVEIDLIITRPGSRDLFIEIKSSSRVDESDAKALETLGRDTDPTAERWLLSRDPLTRTYGQTKAIFWQSALKELSPDGRVAPGCRVTPEPRVEAALNPAEPSVQPGLDNRFKGTGPQSLSRGIASIYKRRRLCPNSRRPRPTASLDVAY